MMKPIAFTWLFAALTVAACGSDDPITALAASPVDRKVAVGDGKEIVIYDLDRRLEIARGTVDSTVTAQTDDPAVQLWISDEFISPHW